jgi:KDO2-lipid IV(A) lauroyltransferase
MAQVFKKFIINAGPAAVDFAQKFFLMTDVEKAEQRGRKLGRLIYRLDGKRRKRAMSNLELAFPTWTVEQRVDLTRRMFEHFGIVAADFFRTPLRTNEELLANTEVEGIEHYESAHAMGRGIIACTGHFGNWERFGHWLMATGRTIAVVARDANQSEIQQRVSRIRSSSGVEVISRGDSAREIIKRLRRNEIIGILPDQNSEETYVPFFGKTCGAVLGPAVLHMRTGAPLVPAYCLRLGPGKYRVVICPPIDLMAQEKDANALTAQINAVLESVIREYPEQWLWMHDRWKSARRAGLL